MVKAVDKGAVITDVRVEEKTGGKSGTYTRRWAVTTRGTVVVASNRAAAGVYDDTTGPLIVEALRADGWEVGDPVVVPDGERSGRRSPAPYGPARVPCSPPAAPG